MVRLMKRSTLIAFVVLTVAASIAGPAAAPPPNYQPSTAGNSDPVDMSRNMVSSGTTGTYIYAALQNGTVQKIWWKNGTIKTQTKLSNDASTLVVADGWVYVNTGGTIYRLDTSNLTEDWNTSTYGTKSPADSGVVETQSKVIAITSDTNNNQEISVLNKSDGTVDTKATLDDTAVSMAARNGRIYVGDVNGNVTAYDKTLTEIWETSYASSNRVDHVAIGPESIYLALRDANKYVRASQTDGSEEWNTSVGQRAITISVSGKYVYFGDFDSTGGNYRLRRGNRSTGVILQSNATSDLPKVISFTTTPDLAYADNNGKISRRDNVTLATNWSMNQANRANSLRMASTDEISSGTQQSDDELVLDIKKHILPGERTPYRVYFLNNSSGTVTRENVTSQAYVYSSNTSVAVVEANNSVRAMQVNGTVTITAEYNGLQTSQEVVVASVTLDNIVILPGVYRLAALANDSAIFIFIIMILVGIAATRLSTSFGGLSMMTMVAVIGWMGGMVGNGLAMVAVFTAMFIGLNLAANIDYTVRR